MDADPSFDLNDHLDSLRESGILTDVVLVCGKPQKEIAAHKVILSGSSPYFRTMFSSSREDRIDLPTIGPEEMDVILPFLYRGKVKEIDDISLLKKVLLASHLLQIKKLFEFTYKRLVPKLEGSNLLDLCHLAESFKDDTMLAYVVTHLAQSFDANIQNEDFLTMSENQMKKIFALLGKFDLSVTSKVFQFLIRWAEVEHAFENRKEILVELLATLDLELLSTQDLIELMQKENVKKNHHLLLLLHNTAILRTLTSGKTAKDEATKSGEGDSGKVSDSRQKKSWNFSWPIFFLLCAFLYQYSTLFYNDESELSLLVFGKKDNQDVYTYNAINHNTWLPAKVLPFTLKPGLSMASFNGYVYIFGGWSTRVLKYSPTSNTVISVHQLSQPVFNPSITVMRNFVYILDETGKSVQRYDLLKNTFDFIDFKFRFDVNPQLFVIADSLYMFGSNSESKMGFQRYDQSKYEWAEAVYVGWLGEFPKIATCGTWLFLLPHRTTAEYYVYDFSAKTSYVFPFKGGAILKAKLFKAVMIRGKCVLLALGQNNVLHKIDFESDGQFTKLDWNTAPLDQVEDIVIS